MSDYRKWSVWKTPICTRELQVMSRKHFQAIVRRAGIVAVNAMNWQRASAERTCRSVSVWQVVDVQQAGRVNDRRLMPGLRLYHHVVFVLHYVIHRVPRSQTATNTRHTTISTPFSGCIPTASNSSHWNLSVSRLCLPAECSFKRQKRQ